MRLMADLWGRLVVNFPGKLAALAVALTVYLFVATDTTTTAQRSLLVPIVIEGVTSDQVVVGLPQLAEVTVSGPATRVDRLRPESFEAVLDLTDVSGDFQAQVAVAPPQGIVLERVVPSEVIGIVETIATAEVPVVPALLGEIGPDRRARISVTPSLAQVRGRAAVVSRAVAVVVPLPVSDALASSSATLAGYAIDGAGRPLADVEVDPAAFALGWAVERVAGERRVPLEVAPLPPDGWSEPTGAPDDVALVGPPSVLAELEQVIADVELPTEVVDGGRYTQPLRLRLPAGVVATEAPTATVTYTASTPNAE